MFKVLTPDSGLNTNHAEMSPFLVDSNTIYFSTMRYQSDEVKKNKPDYIEIKKAKRDSSIWILVDLDLPIFEKEVHIGNGCWSADSTQFFYSRCPSLGECEIWSVSNADGNWGEPEALK